MKTADGRTILELDSHQVELIGSSNDPRNILGDGRFDDLVDQLP